MQFSEHWLRSFVDPAMGSAELGERLTMAGLEVEALVPVALPFAKVVVAQVLGVERHPQADRLSVCRVDAGLAEPLTIVCGAPNVRPGIKVPCAMEGATLPGAVEIGNTAVRGVSSQGMLCSAAELGISSDESGLLILDDAAEVGRDLRRALDLDDHVFTLKLTPNRADCLSIIGLAREVAAVCDLTFAIPPRASIPTSPLPARRVRIDEPHACPRFCARLIDGIDARAPTPDWMKQRLARSGIRSVSAVVDVTNYVMLEHGQPLHAYDNARLDGDIVVRFAAPGEQLQLLNDQTLALQQDLLVVADERKPLGLAGIMGGAGSAIDETTTSVYLEAAFWNPAVIQGKARRLGFTTDAGFRFERGVDFANAPAALDRATELIIELCGGQAGPLADVVGPLPQRNAILVRPKRVSRLVGIDLPADTIGGFFDRLGFTRTADDDGWLVTAPSYRFDIAIEEDLVEEVVRLYGYDRLPDVPAVHRQQMLPAPEGERSLDVLRQRLVDRGYQEVITFSFVSHESEERLGVQARPVHVINPIASQFDVMRSTLIGGLLETLRTNLNRKADRVRVFESGRCFVPVDENLDQPLRVGVLAYGGSVPEQWGASARLTDFYDLKGDIEALASPASVRTEAAMHPALHPGRSARVLVDNAPAGWLGELHPRLVQMMDLPSAPIIFEGEWTAFTRSRVPSAVASSRTPVVRRDLALVVPEATPAEAVLGALRAASVRIVAQVGLFDVYRGTSVGPGNKSLAIRVLMQDTERTLTDPDIDAAMASLVREVEQRVGARLRQ